jgi:NhaP-type Na+/H+ or K+/H+ antiporter
MSASASAVTEPTDSSFLAIGVALTLIMGGEVVVFFYDKLQLQLSERRGISLPHIPDSFIFLILGAMTASLLSLGQLSATTAAVVRDLDASFGEVVIKLLLPPVVMHSALDLGRGAGAVDLGVLAKYTYPGLFLASIGTLLAAFITGLLMYLLGLLGAFPSLGITLSLLLGTCISASDTPAVLNLFATLQPGPEAYALTYIESMFNDAVSIVLFHTISSFLEHPDAGALAVLKACGVFLGVFLGSLLLGCAVGAVAVQLFRTCRVGRARVQGQLTPSNPLEEPTHFPLSSLSPGSPEKQQQASAGSVGGSSRDGPSDGVRAAPPSPPAQARAAVGTEAEAEATSAATAATTPPSTAAGAQPVLGLTASEQVEVTILSLTGFVAYMTAEGVNGSGVVACLSCGVILGRYALPIVSSPSRTFTLGLLKLLASLCDRMVFLGIGIALPELSGLALHWRSSLCLLVSVVLARFAAVWTCCKLVNLNAPPSRPVTTHRARLLVGWAGTVRGGVAFALASLGQGLMMKKEERDGSAGGGGSGASEGGGVFPVSALFVVLATLLVVTLTLPRIIEASPPDYFSFDSSAAVGGGGAEGEWEGAEREARSASDGSSSSSSAVEQRRIAIAGGGSTSGFAEGARRDAAEEQDDDFEAVEASFAELLGGKTSVKKQREVQPTPPATAQAAAGSSSSGSFGAAGARLGGGSGGGRSAGGPAPTGTSSMSTIRGAFGTMIIGGNANTGGASGGSGGGFKSAFSSMIDKLKEKAAPSKSSTASRDPSSSFSGGGGGGGGVGGFAGKISSGVSAFLAPPPPS